MSIYYPPTQNALQKTLDADLNAGTTASTILNNTTGVQNKPGVVVIDRIDTNGSLKSTSVREWVIYQSTSGSTLVNLTRGIGGSSDQDHSVGAVVEFVIDISFAQGLIDALVTVVNPLSGLPAITLGSDKAGDMYFHASGASLSRLAPGTFQQVLAMNASLPQWQTPTTLYQPPTFLTDAPTVILNPRVNNKFFVTVVPDGNPRTYLPTMATLGDLFMLRVQYASTASFAMTFFNSNATLSWASGNTIPTPTQTVAKADIFGFMCMATLPKFDGIVVGQNL
jgi:hypothetical protein